jgi:hypothetical protein
VRGGRRQASCVYHTTGFTAKQVPAGPVEGEMQNRAFSGRKYRLLKQRLNPPISPKTALSFHRPVTIHRQQWTDPIFAATHFHAAIDRCCFPASYVFMPRLLKKIQLATEMIKLDLT